MSNAAPWDFADRTSTCLRLYRTLSVGALQDAVMLQRQGSMRALSKPPAGSLGTLIRNGLAVHIEDDDGWIVKPTPLFHAFMATVREVCNARQ